MLGVTCCRGNLINACSNEVKTKLLLSYCTSFCCSALRSTYTPKSIMDEIHIAHNDVYRLFFKLSRSFISFSQHLLTARIPSFTSLYIDVTKSFFFVFFPPCACYFGLSFLECIIACCCVLLVDLCKCEHNAFMQHM